MNKWPAQPLAERVRPRDPGGYVGQDALLAPGQPLRDMLDSGELRSLLLWGPPGSGKTTLARLLAARAEARFVEISAVSAGVKDIREVIQQAREAQGTLFGGVTVLFIDEIHRFNKAQQDALLHSVETGELILMGATTENPSFEVIPALLSRCQVFTLAPHGEAELKALLERALAEDSWMRGFTVEVPGWEVLVRYAGGDGRTLLNRVEQAVQLAGRSDPHVVLTPELLKKVFQRPLAHDKGGESHYNLASALIKSVRGSDPDAAVYWLARLLAGGEDPLFIARRLVILASEDIGNAEPYALMLATACLQAVHAVGMPEARIMLSQTTTYLAGCPKSNAAYVAINEALADAEHHRELPVPLHLRNAPTALMKQEGYGADYRYSHDFPEHFVEQDYLPERLRRKRYYRPTSLGREKAIRDRLARLWTQRNWD
ncbi:MAG: replication-associated recombination protein A [Candidatus Sericytochromatia bacterium]